MIIDFHTHAFPDKIAQRAIDSLSEHSSPYVPHTDGTAEMLLNISRMNGICKCVLANIATKPAQVHSILQWSKELIEQYQNSIVPLASFHPKSDTVFEDLQLCLQSDLPGIKFHPMYQDFNIDDDRMFDIYREIAKSGKFVLFHNGYDVGFPKSYDNATAVRTARMLDKVPDLKVIVSHTGGWCDWVDAEKYLAGRDIYIECSFINEVPSDILYKMFEKHDKNKFIYGSDTPWLEQRKLIEYINSLAIDDDFRQKLLYHNAARLLGAE